MTDEKQEEHAKQVNWMVPQWQNLRVGQEGEIPCRRWMAERERRSYRSFCFLGIPSLAHMMSVLRC